VIRLGVIGYGYWGPNLVRNFATNGRFQVVAVADQRATARETITRSYPAIQAVESAEELIRRSDLDAVAIATPVATHFPLARAAMLGGKHVLVEKPLCGSAAEGEELVAIARKTNRVLMVDHTFLFTGAVQTIARLVREGALGKISYVDSMRVNLGLFQSDVNCLWDLAPHDLSIIDYLLKDEVVAVDVAGYCHVNPKLPDIVYLTLHFAQHVVAHFNLSWMSPVKVRRFAVGGAKQMLIWDDLDQDQKIRIYNSGIEYRSDNDRLAIIPDYRIGDIYSPRVPRNEALAGVVEHFANVIAEREPSVMDGSAGLRVVRILEQAQEKLDLNLRDIESRRSVSR
jgi:predicted dehydrogenase